MKTAILKLAFLVTIVLSVFTSGAQFTIVIHGQVTDPANQPIPGHQVNILVDSVFNTLPYFTYSSNVITDSNGNYVDSVQLPPGGISAMVMVSVYDCYNNIHNQYQFYMAPAILPAMNFSICGGSVPVLNCDAAVNSILPVNSSPAYSTVSFYIANYGSSPILPGTLLAGCSVNGGSPFQNVYTGTLLPGDSTVVSVPQVLFQQGANTLCCFVTLQCDSNPSNDTLCTTVYFTVSSSFPIVENFDSINPFYTDSMCTWQHGMPGGSIINTAYSSPNAWVTNLNGHYPNNTNCYLYSDVYSFLGLTAADTITLGFRHWCAFASGDFGLVEYSVNGGLNWIILGVTGDPLGTNWYNAFSGGYHYFNYSNSGWIYSAYRLDPNMFNGKPQVQFRFRIFSNASGTSDGWAIDDFSLTASGPAVHAGITSINYPVNNMPAGSIVNTTVTITNYTSAPITLVPVELRLNGLLVATETYVGYIPGNQSAMYTFTTPFTVPAGPYQLCAKTNIPAGGTTGIQYCLYLNGTMNPTGYLYGLLNAGSNPAGLSEVYLIKHDSIAGTLSAVDTTYSVDSSGVTSYHFSNITPGSYLVKAAMAPSNPLYASNMPTYFTSSLFWSQATVVNVLPNAFTQASINFIQGVNPGGPGFVGGMISQGANKGPGDPLEGVQVMLLDANNGDEPVAVTWSDATGLFGFNNIPYGTYKVYAEVLNKTTNPVIVSIDATNPSTDGIRIIVGSTIVSYITEIPGQVTGEIYPNPSSGTCYLPINAEKGTTIRMELYDMVGNIILRESWNIDPGDSTLKIDTESMKSGVYMLVISTSDGGKAIRRLLKE